MPIETIIFRARQRVKRTLVGVIVLSALLAVLAIAVLYFQVDARAGVERAARADVIIVLGSAVWPGGRPSPSLYARTQHAIALYREGYSANLILCGGLGQYPPTEAEAMRKMAQAAGVPSDALILDEASHSTEESLANARALMQVRGWRTALIVSDPFHLLRAETMAKDVGIEAYGSPASDSPTYTTAHLRVWYTTREALALIWYAATRVMGEPTWLYSLLKGRV